jgi:hypothetical protein
VTTSTCRWRRSTVPAGKKPAAGMVVAGAPGNAPGLPGPPGCRAGARIHADLPHGRWHGLVPQAGQLAVAAPVSQPGFALAISPTSARTAGPVLGRPVRPRQPRGPALALKHSDPVTHDQVSRRRESHPPPLAEPCRSLSAHTAPIVQPSGLTPNRQWANRFGYRRAVAASSSRAFFSRRRSRLNFRHAHRTR